MKNLKKSLTLFLIYLVFPLFFGCKVSNVKEGSGVGHHAGNSYTEKEYLDLKYLKDTLATQYLDLASSHKKIEAELQTWQNEIAELNKHQSEIRERDSTLIAEKDFAIKSLKEKISINQNSNYKHIIIHDTISTGNGKLIYPETNPKSVAFYCPEEMKEENTYEVRAMLGYFFENKEIKNELLSAINVTRKEMHENPLSLTDIVTKDVFLGKYMKIELVDPAEKFKIDSTNNSNEPVKIFDDNSNEYYTKPFQWVWEVTPKPNTKGPAVLILVITPYDKNMKPQSSERRNYPINITLKQSFISTMWERANRNPEWALASIITPVITFFVGLFIKKKKNVKENDEA